MSSLPPSSPPSRQSNRQSPNPPTLLPSPIPVTAPPKEEDPPPDPTETFHPTLPPPNFTPFFTLLTTPTPSTTHHPTVHYIFTDDTPDSDPITAAALQVLDPSPSSPPTIANEDENGKAIRERFILIDMDATGSNVVSAKSMSPDWAVTSTEVGAAPTWDRDGEGSEGERGEGEEEEGRGMMLRIEGMEVLGGDDEGGERRLEELVEVYERRMGELRRVVDAGVGGGDME